MIANMIEIQANATPYDAGVFIASCDKGMPGNLMGLARINIPSVVIPGGTMAAGPDLLTLEQLGMYSAKYERGEISQEKLDWAKMNACPSCGACSFIGTASTMQIMAEALGLALPGSALLPAASPDLLTYAYEAGKRAVQLARTDHMCTLIVKCRSICFFSWVRTSWDDEGGYLSVCPETLPSVMLPSRRMEN